MNPTQGIKLAGVPFDLGDHPARLGPRFRLIAEAGIELGTSLGGRPTGRLKRWAMLLCRTGLVGQADGVLEPFGFQDRHNGQSKGGIGTKIDARGS